MRFQKIYRNGNSLAVTIPKDYLYQLGWKVGDKVQVDCNLVDKAIIIKKLMLNKSPNG